LRKDVWLGDEQLISDDIIKNMWEYMFEDKRVSYCIMTARENDFCGYCAVKDLDADKPEIEIELLRKYRGQGIGYQALSDMMASIEETSNVSGFISVVEPDNYISQKLMYKLGGIPAGVRQSNWLGDEDVDDFEKAHMDLLDERLLQVAEDFCVSPQKLLSSVLVFDIPLTATRKEPVKHGIGGQVFDCDRVLSKAIRRYSFRRVSREVLLLLLKYEHDPERAIKEATAYVEAKLKRQL
jgi:RimJ/RimL family protein N-acetyltransferase